MKQLLFGKYRSVQEMLEKESTSFLKEKFPHGKPLSRRDLIKAGAISFAATMTVPYQSYAAMCAANSNPAFVGLKLNGGAAMMGNWLALGADRDYISTYSQLGIGSKSQAISVTTKVFGSATFYNNSQFLAGIRQTATATTLLNTSMIGIPVASTDDTASNAFDITYFVSRMGLAGSILPNLGRQQSATGIAQQPALGKAPPTPLAVSSITDISNALTVQGSLQSLNDSQKGTLFGLISKLTDLQISQLNGATGGDVLAQLITKATGTNRDLASASASGIDPLQDAAYSQKLNTVWAAGNTNMNQQAQTSRERVFGTMVYNSLKGNSGTCNLEMGGYDYHGQGRVNQDNMDLQAGRTMGQILETAAVMQRPVFLMVTSDGAVGAPAGSDPGAAFTGDRGQGGAILCFAYHPLARPQAVTSAGKVDHQVGHVAGQAAVDTTYYTGGDPSSGALAAFINFASFSGQAGRFTELTGSTWSTPQIEQAIRFRKVG